MTRSFKWTVFGSTVGLILLTVLFNTLWISAWHSFVSFLLSSQIFLLVTLITAVLAIVAFKKDDTSYYSHSRTTLVLSVVASAVFLVGSIFGTSFQVYANSHEVYKASTVSYSDDADTLSFGDRVPFDVATAVSSRSLGNTSGNATGDVKSIPGTGEYTTAVVRRGFLQGYESVQVMNLPIYGSFTFEKNVSFCEFEKENANLRLGGAWFSNNLMYPALHKVSFWNPTTKISKKDITMTCDNGSPKVYLPVTKLDVGFFTAHRVPAGVVIYDGKTGELTYEEELSIDGLTLYPISLAESQRNSLSTVNGYGEWLFSRAGFETTSKDEDDVNATNSTEFGLTDTDGSTKFVTPLTPRGSSSSVVALSTLDSSSVNSGSLNSLTVHSYSSPRQAPSTVASSIISTELSGYKANGLTVFEVVPSDNGSWTASIGKNQSILYRAVIDPLGDVVLYDSSGKDISGSSSTGDDETNVQTDKPLDQMTVQELKELADSITSELAERAQESTEG